MDCMSAPDPSLLRYDMTRRLALCGARVRDHVILDALVRLSHASVMFLPPDPSAGRPLGAHRRCSETGLRRGAIIDGRQTI